MTTLDLTKPGGLPLTQDVLAQLQSAYKDIFTAVIGMGADPNNINSTPIQLSGMVSDGVNITDGYFFYNSEVIKFTGGSIPTPTGGQELQVAITTTGTPLGALYHNGSNPSVVNTTSGTLVAATVASNNTTRFKYADLMPYHKFFGLNNGNTNWTASSNSSVGYYQKYLTNSIDVLLTLFSPTDLTSPLEWRIVATFPVRPSNAYWFTAIVQIVDSPTEYPGGTEFITTVAGYFDNSGQMWIRWRKPVTGTYRIGATFTVPLN
jgi:hypothetical protein